jgi:amino acid transporter
MSHSQSSPPPPSGASPAEPTQLGGSGRKLTLVDVVAQSVGFMGPVFSIAFLVPLVMGIISATGNGAGVAAPLSIAIAAVGILAVAYLVAEYAKRIQAAGALYDYVTDGLGQKMGASAGFLYYMGVMALGAGLLVLIAGTIHDTLGAEFSFTRIPITVWAIILLVFVAVVMFLGVALSTRFQLVLALLSVATVLLFSIYVIIKVGSGNDVAAAFNPNNAPGGWSGIAFGMVYGVLLFTGFETAANLGEETEHPKRDIPRAVVTSVIVVAAFYVICSYAQVAGYGFNLDSFGKNASAPLFGLGAPTEAGGYGSVAILRLLELVVVLDMLAVLIGISVASSRGIFAMSRDHRFPSVLGKVSKRGTPLNASFVVLVFFAIWIVLTRQYTGLFAIPGFPHYFAMFNFGSAFGGLALAVIYLLLCVGALRGLRDHPRYAVVVLTAVVGIVVTGAAIFGAIYQVPAPTIYAAYGVGIVFVIGVVLALIAKGPQTAHTSFEDLTPGEAGPVKL